MYVCMSTGVGRLVLASARPASTECLAIVNRVIVKIKYSKAAAPLSELVDLALQRG